MMMSSPVKANGVVVFEREPDAKVDGPADHVKEIIWKGLEYIKLFIATSVVFLLVLVAFIGIGNTWFYFKEFC
jgi:hypothetical protein